MISASITISSNTLSSDFLSIISNVNSLGGNTNPLNLSTGLINTTGLSTSLPGTLIINSADYSGNYNWLFIKNLTGTTSDYITVLYGTQVVGRILGRGQFAFIPYDGSSNISVVAQNAATPIEYILFNEG
jgi:hypothetical protein